MMSSVQGLGEIMAHITRRALLNSARIWELLHHLGNRCLPNIFTGSCEKGRVGGDFSPEINEHLEIFQRFPPIQGPNLDGQMLDFLGISTKVAVACYDAGHSWSICFLLMCVMDISLTHENLKATPNKEILVPLEKLKAFNYISLTRSSRDITKANYFYKLFCLLLLPFI